jgi:DHA1 family multidrug resistance protein-like MFS transporter
MWSFVQRRDISRRIQQAGNPKPNVLEKGNLPSQQNREESVPNHGIKADNEIYAATRRKEAFIIRSSGEDDPLDPLNWPLLFRAKNVAILCLLVFVQGWAGAAESMGNTINSQRFHVSPTAENLATAMYLFGVGSGTIFAGPISESVGRNPTYLASTFCYLWFVLGSALTDSFGGHIVCRFFVGLWSSATLSINGASVSDQFRPVKRAFVFPIVAWANVAGEN